MAYNPFNLGAGDQSSAVNGYAGTSSYGAGSQQLRPDDFAYYNNSRRTINNQYNMGQSNLNLQNAYANQNYETRVGDMTRAFTQQRNALPGGYAQRGLLNSGIYLGGAGGGVKDMAGANGAIQNFNANRLSAFTDLGNQNDYRQSTYANNSMNLATQHNAGLDSLATSQAARTAATAGSIGGGV